jgi:hypothetical protein
MKRIKVLTVMMALSLAVAPAIAAASSPTPQLCEYETCGGQSSALYWATRHAVEDWGWQATGEYCTGPYENVKGRTQWACYGKNEGGWKWQVNVDPYGSQTYAREYH